MGDVGSYMVFENDKIMIWELVRSRDSKLLVILIGMTMYFMFLKVQRLRFLIRMKIFCLPSLQTLAMLSHLNAKKVKLFQAMTRACRYRQPNPINLRPNKYQYVDL